MEIPNHEREIIPEKTNKKKGFKLNYIFENLDKQKNIDVETSYFMPKHPSIVACGTRGGGKTVAVFNLLFGPTRHITFDRLIFISNSFQQPVYRFIKRIIDHYGGVCSVEAVQSILHQEDPFDSEEYPPLDDDDQEIVLEFLEPDEFSGMEDLLNLEEDEDIEDTTVCVFDDLDEEQVPIIDTAFKRGRHFKFIPILICQSPVDAPRQSARTNATFLMCLPQYIHIQTLWLNYARFVKFRVFERCIRQVWSKPHAFFGINMEAQGASSHLTDKSPEKGFSLNFEHWIEFFNLGTNEESYRFIPIMKNKLRKELIADPSIEAGEVNRQYHENIGAIQDQIVAEGAGQSAIAGIGSGGGGGSGSWSSGEPGLFDRQRGNQAAGVGPRQMVDANGRPVAGAQPAVPVGGPQIPGQQGGVAPPVAAGRPQPLPRRAIGGPGAAAQVAPAGQQYIPGLDPGAAPNGAAAQNVGNGPPQPAVDNTIVAQEVSNLGRIVIDQNTWLRRMEQIKEERARQHNAEMINAIQTFRDSIVEAVREIKLPQPTNLYPVTDRDMVRNVAARTIGTNTNRNSSLLAGTQTENPTSNVGTQSSLPRQSSAGTQAYSSSEPISTQTIPIWTTSEPEDSDSESDEDVSMDVSSLSERKDEPDAGAASGSASSPQQVNVEAKGKAAVGIIENKLNFPVKKTPDFVIPTIEVNEAIDDAIDSTVVSSIGFSAGNTLKKSIKRKHDDNEGAAGSSSSSLKALLKIQDAYETIDESPIPPRVKKLTKQTLTQNAVNISPQVNDDDEDVEVKGQDHEEFIRWRIKMNSKKIIPSSNEIREMMLEMVQNTPDMSKEDYKLAVYKTIAEMKGYFKSVTENDFPTYEEVLNPKRRGLFMNLRSPEKEQISPDDMTAALITKLEDKIENISKNPILKKGIYDRIKNNENLLLENNAQMKAKSDELASATVLLRETASSLLQKPRNTQTDLEAQQINERLKNLEDEMRRVNGGQMEPLAELIKKFKWDDYDEGDDGFKLSVEQAKNEAKDAMEKVGEAKFDINELLKRISEEGDRASADLKTLGQGMFLAYEEKMNELEELVKQEREKLSLLAKEGSEYAKMSQMNAEILAGEIEKIQSPNHIAQQNSAKIIGIEQELRQLQANIKVEIDQQQKRELQERAALLEKEKENVVHLYQAYGNLSEQLEKQMKQAQDQWENFFQGRQVTDEFVKTLTKNVQLMNIVFKNTNPDFQKLIDSEKFSDEEKVKMVEQMDVLGVAKFRQELEQFLQKNLEGKIDHAVFDKKIAPLVELNGSYKEGLDSIRESTRINEQLQNNVQISNDLLRQALEAKDSEKNEIKDFIVSEVVKALNEKKDPDDDAKKMLSDQAKKIVELEGRIRVLQNTKNPPSRELRRIARAEARRQNLFIPKPISETETEVETKKKIRGAVPKDTSESEIEVAKKMGQSADVVDKPSTSRQPESSSEKVTTTSVQPAATETESETPVATRSTETVVAQPVATETESEPAVIQAEKMETDKKKKKKKEKLKLAQNVKVVTSEDIKRAIRDASVVTGKKRRIVEESNDEEEKDKGKSAVLEQFKKRNSNLVSLKAMTDDDIERLTQNLTSDLLLKINRPKALIELLENYFKEKKGETEAEIEISKLYNPEVQNYAYQVKKDARLSELKKFFLNQEEDDEDKITILRATLPRMHSLQTALTGSGMLRGRFSRKPYERTVKYQDKPAQEEATQSDSQPPKKKEKLIPIDSRGLKHDTSNNIARKLLSYLTQLENGNWDVVQNLLETINTLPRNAIPDGELAMLKGRVRKALQGIAEKTDTLANLNPADRAAHHNRVTRLLEALDAHGGLVGKFHGLINEERLTR